MTDEKPAIERARDLLDELEEKATSTPHRLALAAGWASLAIAEQTALVEQRLDRIERAVEQQTRYGR